MKVRQYIWIVCAIAACTSGDLFVTAFPREQCEHGLARAAISGFGGREDSDLYWTYHSVIVASVVTVRRNSSESTIIVLHPLGTLTGNFDVGTSREIEVASNSEFHAMPRETVVIYLWDSSIIGDTVSHCRFVIQDASPQVVKPYIIVTGLNDPRVENVLAMVGKLRSKPRVVLGGEKYWQDHSLIYAQVSDVSLAHTSLAIAFDVLGTVSGCYDAGEWPRLTDTRETDKLFYVLDESLDKVPSEGDRMLLVVQRDPTSGEWNIANERATYMPRARDPMTRVSRSGDPKANKLMREAVDSALARIRELRRTGNTDVVPMH
jgi:hypothetical protein